MNISPACFAESDAFRNYDDADDTETAGSGFALRRSLAGLFLKEERLLGTHWLPERPFQENQGSLREEAWLSGFIRPLPRHPPNRSSPAAAE